MPSFLRFTSFRRLRVRSLGTFWVLAGAFVLLLVGREAQAGRPKPPPPTIVDLFYPKDSRGETVYTVKGPKHPANSPIIPGIFTSARLIKSVDTNYPKDVVNDGTVKKVIVVGVVTANGDCIDLKTLNVVDIGYARSALEAVSKYSFKPATLDGKPVAETLLVSIQFWIER